MKTKLLLLFMLYLIGSWLQAQDTIRSLIISEARFDTSENAYIELTNVGDSTLHLKQFELGIVHPGDLRIEATDLNKWFHIGADCWFMLPDTTLDPNESIVFTRASMSTFGNTGEVRQGSDCWYIRYHATFWSGDPAPVLVKDSIVTDQVGGIFSDPDGLQAWGAKDVAGVSGATGNSILVRKYNIQQGNTDFASGRGTDAVGSEWIVIPVQVDNGELFWTVGNHVNANLGADTLISTTVSINRTDSTLVVPWGIRRDSPFMNEFTRKPGIAWHYDYSPNYEDSAYMSVQTGDVLTLYACGDVVEAIPFKIIALDPTADANIAIPKRICDPHLSFAGQGALYEVTERIPGMDTIRSKMLYENSYATHTDTLFKYLQIAPNAEWEILFVEEYDRAFVKNGDILRVTSENGQVKEYYIKVTGQYIEYDAFVTSEVYIVNQIEYHITCNIYGSILVSDFIANLIPAPGATVKVVNAQGIENTGILSVGDVVVVTSADGFKVVTYNLNVYVINGITINSNSISIFPNPTSGNLNLLNLPAQSRIVIKSVLGRSIFETFADSDAMQLSLENQPAGIYFILIGNNSDSACFKLVVK